LRLEHGPGTPSGIEQGTEQFSNVDGIVYIEFLRGQIKSTVSEVLAVLKREKLV